MTWEQNKWVREVGRCVEEVGPVVMGPSGIRCLDRVCGVGLYLQAFSQGFFGGGHDYKFLAP
jgi:hypothetical protein